MIIEAKIVLQTSSLKQHISQTSLFCHILVKKRINFYKPVKKKNLTHQHHLPF